MDSSFAEELCRPQVNNLVKHTSLQHADKLHEAETAGSGPSTTPPEAPPTHGYTATSVKLMDQWLAEGELNPLVEPTRAGFLRLFTAWILEEDMPWTTGEAPRLRDLFNYLKIQFVLPSDTTVCNTLARIFADLHAAVVKELAVHFHVYGLIYTDINVFRPSNRR